MHKVTQLSLGEEQNNVMMRFHAVTLQLFCATMVQTSLDRVVNLYIGKCHGTGPTSI